jgi:predicted RNA binding protein YcfA (HicA-like mRNA interferase family)
MLKKIYGKNCIKILCNKFEFIIKRQKGSHIVLRKETSKGVVVTVVPNHKEIKIGTLKSILKLAKVNEEDFMEYI